MVAAVRRRRVGRRRLALLLLGVRSRRADHDAARGRQTSEKQSGNENSNHALRPPEETIAENSSESWTGNRLSPPLLEK